MSMGSKCVERKSTQCHEAKMKLELALRRYFRHESFRPGQLEALIPIAHGKDVFVRMATGSGKTLCMLLPPLATSRPWVSSLVL